jgi:hypothetical protein
MAKRKLKSKKIEPPAPSSGDTAHLVASGVLSFIPGAPELFSYFVGPPLERKRREWEKLVSEILEEITSKSSIDLATLQVGEIEKDEFLMCTRELAARGLVRISPDIDDFDDIYQVDSLALESTDSDRPRLIVTEIGKKFIEYLNI